MSIQSLTGQDQFKKDLTGCTGSLKRCGGAFDGLIDIKILDIQHPFVDIQLIQSQKTAGKLLKSFCFVGNDLEVFFLHFHRNCTIDHSFHITFDGSQR